MSFPGQGKGKSKEGWLVPANLSQAAELTDSC